jgi:GlpG protein
MTVESTSPPHDKGSDVEGVSSDQLSMPVPQPWITRIAVAVCCIIFVGINAEHRLDSWESLTKWGYFPATLIREGAYWGLVTSAFVHMALWHLAFNMYWLWTLGSRMERSIGSARFLAFILMSAFISSSVQLAISDETGIGASGVVYAIFGFMRVARQRYQTFSEALNQQTINLFVVWLFGCVVATYMKIWEVGNAAHVSGLIFGAAVANYFIARRKPAITLAGLGGVVIFCIAGLFWCPWSITWLSQKAYGAHAAERYDQARDLYSQIIRIDPKNAWAYQNRSYVLRALGKTNEARSDFDKARALDPSIDRSGVDNKRSP